MLVSYVDDNAIAGDEAAIEDTLKGVAIALQPGTYLSPYISI